MNRAMLLEGGVGFLIGHLLSFFISLYPVEITSGLRETNDRSHDFIPQKPLQ
jgi:hypothetical protein